MQKAGPRSDLLSCCPLVVREGTAASCSVSQLFACNGSTNVLVYFSPSQATSRQTPPWGTIYTLFLSLEEP